MKAVTVEEIWTQLKHMKSGKAADDEGIVAELLCTGNDLMMQMIAEIFTAILDPAGAVPDYWRASSIRGATSGYLKTTDQYAIFQFHKSSSAE